MPARLSVAADTPTSRQVAYEMPLRSPYALRHADERLLELVEVDAAAHRVELGLEIAPLLEQLQLVDRASHR